MDNKWKYRTEGSEAHDKFKLAHKTQLGVGYYASDVDLALVSKNPPGPVAYLDYKRSLGEGVTFAEVLLYNALMRKAPVYIVTGDPEKGPFVIRQYLGGDWRPDPPQVEYGLEIHIPDWKEFRRWENKLRNKYEEQLGSKVCVSRTYVTPYIL